MHCDPMIVDLITKMATKVTAGVEYPQHEDPEQSDDDLYPGQDRVGSMRFHHGP